MSASHDPANDIALRADVFIAGGGPAGTWAALTAARSGATVVLADKGYCGTSGAAAASNNNVWYVPDPEDHARHFEERYRSGGALSELSWTSRVLETSARQLQRLETLGYPFARKDDGTPNRATLRGPDYMRFMRQQIKRAGVTILDHAPLLGLVRDEREGRVTGAFGVRRDGSRWHVSANACVIATGGCAFLGGALGTNVCTGDGHLAAAEAGALFSGMEFSSQYGLTAAFSSVTKGLPFVWASYSTRDGRPVHIDEEDAFIPVARTLVNEPVFAVFDRATPDIERWLRSGQANAFLPYDRMGIDPFRTRFPVGLRLEGTVRGTGGIRLVDTDGRTDVPGLYAAGDAASREAIVGARTGGGSPNGAWAIATGSWTGEAASRFAKTLGETRAIDFDAHYAQLATSDPHAAAETLEREVRPIAVQLFRSERRLAAALRTIDHALVARPEVDTSLAARRSARALLYVAKLSYTSALARRETRGLHRREDFPLCSDDARRLLIGGVQEPAVRWRAVAESAAN
ncbi:FAD-binding protein [Paraburkholderia unamae]|uniref:FAD-dependent oxidoreductase n=1 Tax=Paraburkholderia unamae TaxID=219649 RepID=UPI001CB23D11|nr:FAD-binding protein [Paraburkholderia unamae]CAG9265409.1 FAD-binding protein [Paraburkholderia unamae]